MASTTLYEGMSGLQSLPPVPLNFTYPPASSSTIDYLDQLSAVEALPDIDDFSSIPIDFDTQPFLPSTTSNPSFPTVRSGSVSSLDMGPAIPMSELMKGELNHLFFDRVHLFAPILNSRRYFARASRPRRPTAPFVGLQYAMWTLASWIGGQIKEIQTSLYNHTRALLADWELQANTESPPIELTQAWILLAIYEIMQVNYDRGWLSAGRCFRLVQLLKLHELDAPNGVAKAGLTFVEIEERRRTFWLAYSLDRFINLINQMPLTLNEQVVSLHHMCTSQNLWIDPDNRSSLAYQLPKQLFHVSH